MKIVYFTHSLASCWNHGNAHFLRGVLRELIARGHDVTAHEPEGAWSLQNLIGDHGEAGLDAYRSAYPELSSTTFAPDADVEALVDGADVVIVHEWNEPSLVAAIGAIRARGGRFTLLFHDTHHRAVSDPDAIRAFDLGGYDGILAFGETLSEVYRRWGWSGRVWTWHEAADTRHFHPPRDGEGDQPQAGGGGSGTRGADDGPPPSQASRAVPLPVPGRAGLVWIGNWGDGERTSELESFLFQPARDAGLPLDIFGVRYPPEALQMLERYDVRYRGWLPNARAPEVFARHLATVHVPRRYYSTILPGIPTIRVFEALACGIPLVSAPWEDSEGLFCSGQDYLTASDGPGMTRQLERLKQDPDLRRSLVDSGLETIRARHTCGHRADELLAIVEQLRSPLPAREELGGGWQPKGLEAREDAPSSASSGLSRHPPLDPLPGREGEGLRKIA
jgi:spore maturation protein CgeB